MTSDVIRVMVVPGLLELKTEVHPIARLSRLGRGSVDPQIFNRSRKSAVVGPGVTSLVVQSGPSRRQLGGLFGTRLAHDADTAQVCSPHRSGHLTYYHTHLLLRRRLAG
jgi:hypothetical protein